jgi:DNA-binding IclR family transcriptional regulator
VVSPGSVEAVSTGVAVPVRDETGEVVAALSVVLPRETPPEVAITELLRATRDIRAALSSRPRR